MSTPVNVAIALVFRGEKLLITRRLPDAHLEGLWEFPGGKIKAAETPERCAEREVLEETGVQCGALACRAPIAFSYPERDVVLTPVDCEWLSGEPTLLEVAEARWVMPAELIHFQFPEANSALLQQLLARA